jgi:predicted Ser/Thr protein kinase
MGSSGTRIGTEIAGFRIESVLGRGGMSVVYLAEQMRLGRKVALKILASGLIERDESFRNRFLQESRVAASLDHPNIIPIYDAGEVEGSLYIAMRYVEGRDLAQILEQEGPLGLGRTIFILDQVARALDAAHERDLVHRDVKPANVLLVGNSDRVYLTDFGVAKPITSGGLTRTGLFIGTPDYSAPEQIEGREVDARTDVYALTAVLYSCLTGLAPYARNTEVAVLQAHLLEPPPRIKDQRPDLPRGLDRVIATGMAKLQDDRYPTCGDLLAAAEAAAHERASLGPVEILPAPGAAAPAVTQARPAAPEPPPPQALPAQEPSGRSPFFSGGRVLVALLVAAVVALAAVLAVVLATRDNGTPGAAGPGARSTTYDIALSADAEVPASSNPTSSGAAEITIDGPRVCWSFQLKGVADPTFAHIHAGGPTVSGPIDVPLGSSFKPSGCTTSTRAVTAAILRNPAGYYANVHSLKFPDGAVRGQLQPPTGTAKLHLVGLAGIVPKGIFTGCKLQATPIVGAVQTAACAPPAGIQVFYPQRLELSTFTTTAALEKAYDAARKAASVRKAFGRCDGTNWLGEGEWFHAPEAPGHPGKAGGRRFCYFDGDTAVIVWTHEKFAQATHVDLLGVAHAGGSDHTDLFSWWRFWTHRIGKCLQVGCTASAS